MAVRERGERRVDHDDKELLARRFEADRRHLRAVAYRMLGSLGEAEDAVQETWLKLSRSDVADVANLSGWLTTVIGRVCLDMLRSRGSRREDPLEYYVPDPVVRVADTTDPEHAAEVTESVGLALLVVLDTLAPAERLAFVLHDMFAVSFDEIAPVVDRTPAATRQLASRARRRVRDTAPAPGPDPRRQREIADAFLAASHGGDFEGLLAVLDPDVVLRADGGRSLASVSRVVRGAEAVIAQALTYAKFRTGSLPMIVNGAPAVLSVKDGRPGSLLAFTVVGDRIVELHVLADPERIAALGLTEEELARARY
ncbi:MULTISPECIES: sigma-70 family RNA polymerase sigma factor [unclassified Streptomyces]|uniref:sigma-70 family RNA polymerase sigma factor n=1 Tax=unclassified Streptomyces TaxID=2593676 RepID=UPI00166022E1|nr:MULTISPECIES: sigma-70 family RNA polymerase sigma factor [unclassified Streptomyces]MBD0709194.1 RNA polymerase subunit sigma-70 [Streptomyces sp. CBMA291]MBD0714451.1 RNA polymerase subunit sigma-70 [Streptomyces sp. CBMA370]